MKALYTLILNNREYNLNNVYDRIALRDTLSMFGFFKDEENKKYYPWFAEESIGKANVMECLSAIKLFIIARVPKDLEKLN